jgi:hypothetical protein
MGSGLGSMAARASRRQRDALQVVFTSGRVGELRAAAVAELG